MDRLSSRGGSRIVGRRSALLRLGAGSAGLLATATGVACRGGEDATGPASTRQPVTLLYGTSFSALMQERYKELLVDPFQQKFPHITVEIDPAAHTRSEKFKTSMAAGTFFDAVWGADNAMYAEGFVADMAAYVKRDRLNLASYPRELYESLFTVKDKVTGIPNQTGGNLMAIPYNRSALLEAGLKEPPTQWGDPTWTWEVFVDYYRKVAKVEGGVLARAGTQPASQNTLIGNLAYLWGGQWVSNDRRRATCDSAEMIKCYQDYFALATDQRATLQTGQGQALFGTNTGTTLLGNQRLAFLLSMSSATLGILLDQVRKSGDDIAFAPLPRQKNVASFQWLDANGIVKGARNPDAAWQYTHWQGTTMNWAQLRGTPPPRKEHIEQWAKENFADIPEKTRLSVVLKVLEHPGPYDPGWVLPKFGFNGGELVKAWTDGVPAGQANVPDGLRTLKPQLQAMIDAEDNKYKV